MTLMRQEKIGNIFLLKQHICFLKKMNINHFYPKMHTAAQISTERPALYQNMRSCENVQFHEKRQRKYELFLKGSWITFGIAYPLLKIYRKYSQYTSRLGQFLDVVKYEKMSLKQLT